MKKKIISIGILGMFLLLSCSALSTVGQKVETSEQAVTNVEDLPDLTIEIKLTYRKIGDYYRFEEWIRNEGTSTIPAGVYIVTRYFSTSGEGSWGKYPLANPLNPGGTVYAIGSFPRENFEGKVMTAVVDPPASDDYPWPELNPDPVYGLIKESNEDNNFYDCSIPHARSYSSFSPLFLLLSRLPIFDEEFVQELRDNVDILSNGPGGSQFCDAVWDARAQVAYLIEWYFDHDLNFMAVFLIYSIAWPLQTIYETFCSPTGAS